MDEIKTKHEIWELIHRIKEDVLEPHKSELFKDLENVNYFTHPTYNEDRSETDVSATPTEIMFDTFLQGYAEYIITSAVPEYISETAKFTDLSDTPNKYEGNSRKFIRINEDETGLEFVEFDSDSFSQTPTDQLPSNITEASINNWNEAYNWGDHAEAGYLTSGEVQSDWNEENSESLSYIKNKPTIPETSAYDAHIETSAIHFEKTDIDYSDIQNTPETSAYDAHIETSAIHFEKTDIDYSDIQNTPETSAYDAHIETSAIHFEKTDIDYSDIQNTPETSAYDAHIETSAIHFTQDNISITESQISDLQNYLVTETDPTVPAHVKAITTTDITNWNGKENVSNKKTDLTDNNDIFYPSVKAVNDALLEKTDTPTKLVDQGYTYDTVRIGEKVYTVQNFRGTSGAGSEVTDNTTWGNWTSAGWCKYGNDPANEEKYGKLYNWFAVDNLVLPAGWRVPTDAEYTELENYLIEKGHNWDGSESGNKIAKAMASNGGEWSTSETVGRVGNDQNSNNSSGFSALPGGVRRTDGYFLNVGSTGYWWSATEFSASNAWYRTLYYNFESLYGFDNGKRLGLSVRLVRDISPIKEDGDDVELVNDLMVGGNISEGETLLSDKYESLSNKKTNLTDNSDVFYPSVNAVNAAITTEGNKYVPKTGGDFSADVSFVRAGAVVGEIGLELKQPGFSSQAGYLKWETSSDANVRALKIGTDGESFPLSLETNGLRRVLIGLDGNTNVYNDLTVGGSINEGGTALSSKYSAISHSHGQLTGSNYLSGGNELPEFFGPAKLRYQMLGSSTGNGGVDGWCDTLWISSYVGGDVKGSNLLVMTKTGDPKIGFRRQDYDATAWGTFYELYGSHHFGLVDADYSHTSGFGTGKAISKHNVELVKVTRNDNSTVLPLDYTQAVHWRFAPASSLNSPPGLGSWRNVMTVQGWTAYSTHYPSYQLSFGNGAVGVRQATSSTDWGNWRRLVEEDHNGDVSITNDLTVGGDVVCNKLGTIGAQGDVQFTRNGVVRYTLGEQSVFAHGVLPDNDDSRTLGDPNKRWRAIYIAQTANIGTDLTVGGNALFQEPVIINKSGNTVGSYGLSIRQSLFTGVRKLDLELDTVNSRAVINQPGSGWPLVLQSQNMDTISLLNGGATITNDLTVGGAVTVTGKGTFDGNVFINGLLSIGTENHALSYGSVNNRIRFFEMGIEVYEDAIISWDVDVGRDLTVGGDATIDNDLTVGGANIANGERVIGDGGGSAPENRVEIDPANVKNIDVNPSSSATQHYKLLDGVNGQDLYIYNNKSSDQQAVIFREDETTLVTIQYRDIALLRFWDGEWRVI